MGTDREPLSAAVLAGGKSSRMGRDKALLPLRDGGPPLLAIVLERLGTVADDLRIVASDRERYDAFGVPVVPDLYAGGGALVGIHAAIVHAKHRHCLVVACDMPFLNDALLDRMAREPRDYDVLVPLLPGDSRQGRDGLVYQTLHAIYSKRCASPIEASIAAGIRQVVGFFSQVNVRVIPLPEIEMRDPGLRSFFNANTPQALATAKAIASQVDQTTVGRRSARGAIAIDRARHET